MSENKDILDYIVKCLLKHRAEKNNNQSSNLHYIRSYDSNKTRLVKRNIQYIIQQKGVYNNLDTIYGQFDIEPTSISINY